MAVTFKSAIFWDTNFHKNWSTGSEFEIERHTEHCVVMNILSLFTKDTKDRTLHAKSDV
jgi:hypothetical protein